MTSPIPMQFFSSPQSIKLSKSYEAQYLYFDSQENNKRPPIVILGGAFQRFEAFRRDVEILRESYPVYLLDLPGQGGNQQLAPELRFEDYAELLDQFCEKMRLETITPMAMSYGSAIGFHFAKMFPEKTHKLILAGTTPSLRDSAKKLLHQSLEMLDQGHHEEFATGVVLNLMNYPRRKQIRGAEILARVLFRNMKNLNVIDRLKYKHNTQRLLNQSSLSSQGPICETLVLAGEWDHFTTPYECFQVAKSCPNSVFTIAQEVDHLAPYLKKEAVNQTFVRFLLGERLACSKDIAVYREDDYPTYMRQIEPRFPYNQRLRVKTSEGHSIPVDVMDVNAFGLCFNIGELPWEFFKDQDITLEISSQTQAPLELIPFHYNENKVSALFKRTHFGLMNEIESFLEKNFRTDLLEAG